MNPTNEAWNVHTHVGTQPRMNQGRGCFITAMAVRYGAAWRRVCAGRYTQARQRGRAPGDDRSITLAGAGVGTGVGVAPGIGAPEARLVTSVLGRRPSVVES